MASPGRLDTGSFDQGVSWKSRLLRLQLNDAPSAEV